MRVLKCENGVRLETFEENGEKRIAITEDDGRWHSFGFGKDLTPGEKQVILEMVEQVLAGS